MVRQQVKIGHIVVAIVAFAALVLVGCSSTATDSGATANSTTRSDAGPTSVVRSGDENAGCGPTATAIVDRFEAFLEPFADLSPIEFLSLEEPVGVAQFRSDVGAEIVAGTAAGCDDADLDVALRDELDQLSGRGPLVEYVAASILDPGPPPQAEPAEPLRELAIGPADDLAAAVASLGPAATLTLAAGTYDLTEPLVANTELTILGAGIDETIIRSSAPDAVIAVVDGALRLENLSVEHLGQSMASVVISFARPLHLDAVRLTGATTDSDGGGGTGLVVTDAVSIADGANTLSGAPVTIERSELVNNAIAGAAISADIVLDITTSQFADNGVCGLCLFDSVQGAVIGNTFDGNTIGLQISDTASPEVTANSMTNNNGVGIVVGNMAAPEIAENRIDDNTDAGIELQDRSMAVVRENAIGAHPAAIVVNGEASPTIESNTIEGGGVGIQIGGESAGTASDNVLTGVGVGLVAAGGSTATFSGNQIDGGRIGIEANGLATPTFEDNSVSNVTTAGLVYLDDAAGTARRNSLTGPMMVGVQIGGDAQPLLDEIVVTFTGGQEETLGSDDGSPPVGMLVAEQSTPTVTNSTISGFLIGLQVSGAAQPNVSATVIDGGSLDSVGLLFGEFSGGTVRDNTMVNHLIGVQVGGAAAPSLTANDVDAATQASYLITGSATPVLDGNRCSGLVPGIVLLEAAGPELGENDCPIAAG